MENKEKNEVQEEVKQEEMKEEVLKEQTQKEESQQEEPLAEKDQKEETKEKHNIPFFNKKVNKDTAKAFFAGVGTTLILGLAFCSICHNDNFYHKEFHSEAPVVNKSVSESFGQSTGYKTQRILDQLHQINREIKEINQKLDNNIHSSFKEPSGESETFSSSYGESESFYKGRGFGRGHSYSKSFSETENRDFKIVQNGNKVKLFVYNPSKVDIRFEPEGNKISGHYYVEKVFNGKTIIHVDDTVKIFDGR